MGPVRGCRWGFASPRERLSKSSVYDVDGDSIAMYSGIQIAAPCAHDYWRTRQDSNLCPLPSEGSTSIQLELRVQRDGGNHCPIPGCG